jgi:hypothetical protein
MTTPSIPNQERQIVAVGYDMKRDIFPSGKNEKGDHTYLAIGLGTQHIIIKTPSGKHFACPCPEDLIIDLWANDCDPSTWPNPEDKSV